MVVIVLSSEHTQPAPRERVLKTQALACNRNGIVDPSP